MNHDMQLIFKTFTTQTNVKKELFAGRTVLFGQYVTAGTDCWNNSPMQFRVLGQKKCQPHPSKRTANTVAHF